MVMAELSQRIQRAYEWDSMAEPAPRGYDPPVDLVEIELPDEVLREYVGEYRMNDQVTMVVTLEDGALFAQPTGQQRLPIFATEIDHFFLRAVRAEVVFTRGAAGEVSGITVVQGGGRQSAPRVR
jgi:hypothetical protein